MNTEVWKAILGYEGVYEVSNFGRVKRLAGSPKCKHDRFLKPSINTGGYCAVVLCVKGITEQAEIHRVVAVAFLGNSYGLWVNHIDGCKTNNNASNLEYLTPGDNLRHAYAVGLMPTKKGEGNPHAKATEDVVREIRRLYQIGVPRKELVNRFRLSKTAVRDIVTRYSWRHI